MQDVYEKIQVLNNKVSLSCPKSLKLLICQYIGKCVCSLDNWAEIYYVNSNKVETFQF